MITRNLEFLHASRALFLFVVAFSLLLLSFLLPFLSGSSVTVSFFYLASFSVFLFSALLFRLPFILLFFSAFSRASSVVFSGLACFIGFVLFVCFLLCLLPFLYPFLLLIVFCR